MESEGYNKTIVEVEESEWQLETSISLRKGDFKTS